uniref:Protein DPCD n=1 Tax=Ciona savignyi TaxID=51511 RepID=H2YAG7_CIOSA
MPSKWVELLTAARKTALLQEGRRKIHFTMSDGAELLEEYDVRSNELLVRKWRRKSALGGQKGWEYEVGEADLTAKFAALSHGSEHVVESHENPICFRCDTKKLFQWRIRNLPFPTSTYELSIRDQSIVVRTSNKKYFKILQIPDMERYGLSLNESELSFAHANNTLIVQYKKPVEIITDQDMLMVEFKKMKVTKEGDAECNQS